MSLDIVKKVFRKRLAQFFNLLIQSEKALQHGFWNGNEIGAKCTHKSNRCEIQRFLKLKMNKNEEE